MTNLSDIEKLTQTFSAGHDVLAGIVSELSAETEALRRHFLPRIRKAVAATAQAKLILHSAIEQSPALFEKPRTQIFHGVKVGFQKDKGGIEFEDADKVLALIHKIFGDDALAYIRTVESPDKKMLAELPVNELKKLGCTVADTGDQVVIKPTDSEVEKTVAALLKGAVEIEAD